MDDSDVIKCMKLLTFLPLEEIAEYEKLEGAELNKAKDVLAFELTKLVHGEEEAKKAREASIALLRAALINQICLAPLWKSRILLTAVFPCLI